MDHIFTTTNERIHRPGLLHRLGVQLTRWQQLARQRNALRHLDERTLRDIGIDRYEALTEARRPFWDDPRG